MKYIKNISVIILTMLLWQGCEDSSFLNTKPLNAITSDAVFSDPELARASLLNIYYYVPKVFSRGTGVPLDLNTRDAGHSFPWEMVNQLKNNNYNAANLEITLQDFWHKNYSYVRQTNMFIQGVENSNFDSETKKVFLSEAYFLRGVFYLDMYRFFGGVPIIETPQDINDPASFNVERNTATETVNFIIRQFELAADYLPKEWTGRDKGRAEVGAAYGMAARVCLHAASLTKDRALFEKAAGFAWKVIELNKYSLYPDFNKLFLTKDGNNEYIFYYNYIASNYDPWARFFLLNAPLSAGAWGGVLPSQNLVDEFEMIDGKLPSESQLYDEQNPYLNRDPRFYATFYYQGTTFKNVPFEFYIGGKDYVISGFLTSGYYLKKGIDESVANYYDYNGNSTSMYDPILRYADVLLMYAEAQNELGNIEDARIYINQVRQRVEMPEIPQGLTQDEMRTKIRHERHIELCFEESRFHDVRRWGIAAEVCTGPVWGQKITQKQDGTLVYERQKIDQDRVFDSKYALFPIPQSEINKNPKLTQNPGY
ncbi:RagB/SusD family nutrient uptake outer membrane protein [Bacteroides sp.]|uniref:RagB/SusD family nutrient uptake outer membrane protein n=1 Tax=Bacteroides sp. TaxID=29523 RepID=UPI003AB78419